MNKRDSAGIAVWVIIASMYLSLFVWSFKIRAYSNQQGEVTAVREAGR